MRIRGTTLSRGRTAATVAALALVVVVVLGVMSASADHVDPVFTAGNPTCPAGTTEYEIDGKDFANGTSGDGTLSVTISNFDGPTATFDWSANMGVDQVIVKGGDNANVYTYDPEETSDTGLHTPFNESSGQNYGLSHVSFCYDGTPPSPSPSPSVSPSETETGSPSPSVSPTETETGSPSPSVSPTETETETPGVTVSPTQVQSSPSVLGRKVLSNTGADVMRLLLAGLMLVALGVVAFVVASRSRRSEA